jgi:hypothetical protein
MELVSTILSRSVYLLELDSLNPFGVRSAAEVAVEIQDRFGFAKIPDIGEAVTDKGATFLSGRFEDIVIDKLVQRFLIQE